MLRSAWRLPVVLAFAAWASSALAEPLLFDIRCEAEATQCRYAKRKLQETLDLSILGAPPAVP